jgi:peptide-methionine (S)-S-oxide reductase
MENQIKRIVIAGGCFWGVEQYYRSLKGIITTTVGYTNGNIKKPKYEDLLNKIATHSEACEIYYDSNVISLKTILEHMFRFIDPTSVNKQGGDVGLQYRTGIYYKSEEDYKLIKEFIDEKQKDYNKPIAVEVLEEHGYFLAEEYHQDYLIKHPTGYCHVNLGLIKKDEMKSGE